MIHQSISQKFANQPNTPNEYIDVFRLFTKIISLLKKNTINHDSELDQCKIKCEMFFERTQRKRNEYRAIFNEFRRNNKTLPPWIILTLYDIVDPCDILTMFGKGPGNYTHYEHDINTERERVRIYPEWISWLLDCPDQYLDAITLLMDVNDYWESSHQCKEYKNFNDFAKSHTIPLKEDFLTKRTDMLQILSRVQEYTMNFVSNGNEKDIVDIEMKILCEKINKLINNYISYSIVRNYFMQSVQNENRHVYSDFIRNFLASNNFSLPERITTVLASISGCNLTELQWIQWLLRNCDDMCTKCTQTWCPGLVIADPDSLDPKRKTICTDKCIHSAKWRKTVKILCLEETKIAQENNELKRALAKSEKRTIEFENVVLDSYAQNTALRQALEKSERQVKKYEDVMMKTYQICSQQSYDYMYDPYYNYNNKGYESYCDNYLNPQMYYDNYLNSQMYYDNYTSAPIPVYNVANYNHTRNVRKTKLFNSMNAINEDMCDEIEELRTEIAILDKKQDHVDKIHRKQVANLENQNQDLTEKYNSLVDEYHEFCNDYDKLYYDDYLNLIEKHNLLVKDYNVLYDENEKRKKEESERMLSNLNQELDSINKNMVDKLKIMENESNQLLKTFEKSEYQDEDDGIEDEDDDENEIDDEFYWTEDEDDYDVEEEKLILEENLEICHYLKDSDGNRTIPLWIMYGIGNITGKLFKDDNECFAWLKKKGKKYCIVINRILESLVPEISYKYLSDMDIETIIDNNRSFNDQEEDVTTGFIGSTVNDSDGHVTLYFTHRVLTCCFPLIDTCEVCHSFTDCEGGKLKKCGQCGNAKYCSVKCQAFDWGEHSTVCH